MKKSLLGTIIVAVLLVTPFASPAGTIYFDFTDTFDSSTVNSSTPAAPTTNSTAYQILSAKPWYPVPSINTGHLQFGITNTTGGVIEIQALFASNAVVLAEAGQCLQLVVTFTDASGLLTQNSQLGFGMYYSGGVAPLAGGLNGTATTSYGTVATGGAQNWQGYAAIIGDLGANYPSGIFFRTNQTGSGNNNQDLVTRGSSSQSFYNSPAVAMGAVDTNGSVNLADGSQYTDVLTFSLMDSGSLVLDNKLYPGAGTNVAPISSMTATSSIATAVTSFDGLAIGWRAMASTEKNAIDLNSVTARGAVYKYWPFPFPYGPASVIVATNGSCAFQVVGTSGVGLAYQWHRNGTNLVDGGNISGANTAMLVVSNAGTNDACTGDNGYYLTVTGAGGYSINSTNASLRLCPAATLVWSGNGSDWDIATSYNWLDGVVGTVFNYGDNVIFDDTADAGQTTVNLAGNYLSAAQVTVSNSAVYTFAGSGSIAGPGALIYEGSGPLILDCANSYSGGTVISNSGAYLVLKNYNGLGTGPVTLAKAGGMMEIVPAGNASTGIKGDVNVADDFTIQFDGTGAYAGVFLGNLSGTAGKTLTLNPSPGNTGTNERIRICGTHTTYDANLALNSPLITLASYGTSGQQTYNGVISGSGALIQKGSTICLNGANTYSGGTFPAAGAIGFGIDSTGNVASGPIGIGPLLLTVDSTSGTTGSGQVFASGGARTIANPIQYPSATNNLTLIIGGANALTFTGPITLNGNDYNGTFTNRIFQVTNTALTAFAGIVCDGGLGFGLTKTGKGVLVLNNTETYTGPTTVSNGTLQVNGTLDTSSAVTVCLNGILAGTGTVNGAVAVQTNGTIAPGADAIGTLALGSLNLAGNMRVRVNRSGFASDKTVGTGSLNNTGAGTVLVTNTGAALQPGDAFTLFNKAVVGGDNLMVVGAGASWSNRLADDGTIVVSSTNPPVMGTMLSGPTLTLGWPGYPGWLVQSNSAGLAATSNWFVVPNPGNVTTLDITVTAQTNVFYRLVCP